MIPPVVYAAIFPSILVPSTATPTIVSLICPIISTVIPPAVPHLHLKYGSIVSSTLKPLGRPCIPFHSIPQTAEAGSAGYLRSNGMERNAVFA
ncbi:hypothetical protein XELAEV_18042082mg [Xenopus laevis]|uniref:Uncharacterized protein n=1 Tax=Xenopus laevis TaxID=8355 RepID=A0A974C3J2_XENLA|nr:hypothetical protein XELAEV_18042082mg [Xenopus laevis]